MKIPDKEMEKIESFLDGIGLPDCPVCQKNKEWIISGRTHGLSVLQINPGRRSSMPIVAMACDNCGYVLSFNYFLIKERINKEVKDEKSKGIQENL